MADCATGCCDIRLLSRDEKRKEFEHDPANAQDTCQGLRDDLFSIGFNYFAFDADTASIEEKLHDAWDEVIHAAKIIPFADAEIDRLVTLILELRELGQLARKHDDATSNEAAIMPNGQRLWIDLPYLADELYESWTNESMAFAAPQRQSLAVLTSKLYAAGACAADLAHCALWLFKEALETERPQTASFSEEGTSNKSKPPIADMLLACLQWFKYGKIKLAKLSVENYHPASGHDDQDSTSPGPLATEAGITNQGFSLARWLFWRRRLGELYRHGCDQVAKPAKSCFEEMVNAGSSIGIDIPGEKRFLEKSFEVLDRELLSRNSQGSVGIEEIEIDPTWADEE
ncbi:hypothetical protein HRG_006276 [Hirsutella rhossiliensis]|uniref:Uncharacterized protein n=1 Tax=Hirsutella rhossiliensis TaxID=111463 RepID=A0A9P8MXF4_9HYPO|nr:uncharacterized protein HRG_06276 [Hirsutella rhossiliensis]KAH0962174.1 hypothetical protein HRG_06276 [Hirsutella rhossiliensis]